MEIRQVMESEVSNVSLSDCMTLCTHELNVISSRYFIVFKNAAALKFYKIADLNSVWVFGTLLILLKLFKFCNRINSVRHCSM